MGLLDDLLGNMMGSGAMLASRGGGSRSGGGGLGDLLGQVLGGSTSAGAG